MLAPSSLLLLAFALAASAASTACGSPRLGPAPEISDLTLPSIFPADTTHVNGTVHVADPFGLTALLVNVTIQGPMSTLALPPITVDSTVVGQLEATVRFGFKSKADFTSGTYEISVVVTEAGTPSNTLTSMMLVE